MKKILIFACGILGILSLNAQNETFPLLYSQYGINGTASYIGKAGAIGAIGGDIMASHYNPAGLGLYTRSELTFSSGMDITYTKSNFNGLNTHDSYPAYNYGNLGMVLDFKNSSKDAFKHVQVSFGLNRLMNFNNRTKIVRNDLNKSYIDAFVMDNIVNNQDSKNNFITSGVVSLDSNGTISSVYTNGTFNQIKSIRESGYLNEFSMSLSTNYENWLYLGATLGIPFGDYTCKTSFSEERYVAGQSTGYYTYNTEQDLSATGVNLKLGLIAKPVQWLRLGVAIHTPTYYSVKDDYYAEVQYNQWDGGWFPTLSYNMHTPFRFLTSAAVVLGNNKSKIAGTLSFDYEYADYSFMTFDMDDNTKTETELNNNIDNMFKSANTFRVGGEMKLDKMYLRAGYANIGNPYQSAINDGSWDYVTCGVGYKGKFYTFDLAYAYGKQSDGKYFMYSNDNNPITTTSINKHLIEATIGIRF